MLQLRRFLLLVALIGLYTNLGLVLGGTYVGGLVAALAGLGLLWVNAATRLHLPIAKSAAGIAGAGLLWILTIPLSPDPAGFAGEHIRSTAMLIASMLGAFGVFVELTTYRHDELAKLCTVTAGTLLTLALLEVYTPFKGVSEAVRSHIYAGRFIYMSDLRDAAIAGGVRPKVFTQEPSHLAKAVSVTLAGAVILSRHRRRYLWGAAGWLLAMWLLRSPTLLLAAGGIAAAHVFTRPSSWATRVAVTMLPVLALTFLQDLAGLLPFARAQMIASGQDTSFLTRSIGPALIALETMKAHPLAGAGIGGRELVTDIVVGVYQQFPGYWIGKITRSAGYAGWGNAFFEIFTYGGVIMSAIIVPVTLRALRAFNYSLLLVSLVFFLTFNFDSGFVSARPWFYFAALMAIVAVAQRSASSTAARQQESQRRFGEGKWPWSPGKPIQA